MNTQDIDTIVPAQDEPLPPLSGRWVVKHKAQIVAAVRNGTLTLQDALRR
jgi:hypothetical protein